MAGTTFTAEAPTARRLLRWAPVVFLAASSLGILMRLQLAGVSVGVPFDHLLHAHSHAMYFGWAALVVLGAAAASPATRRWSWAALVLVPAMTVAFLAQGYGPASIAASTAVMVVWYGAIVSWWRTRSDEAFFPSFLYVVVASAGIWVLAALQATGHGDELAGRLAIHAFLSTFAWSLVLGGISLCAGEGLVAGAEARRASTWIVACGWLLFPLGVVGGPELPVLGWAARVAAVVLMTPLLQWCLALWRSGDRALRAAAVWLIVAAGGLVAVAIGGSPLLATVGRPGIVIYLHALLLGHVTSVLVAYLARVGGLDVEGAVAAHHLGMAVMLAAVAAPLVGVPSAASEPVATAGALTVWGAAWWWSIPYWRAR